MLEEPFGAGEGAGRGAEGTGQGAQQQGQQGQNDQDHTVTDDHVHAAAGLDLIDQLGNQIRDDALENHLAGDQNRRQDRRLLVFPNAFGQGFDYHVIIASFPKVSL